MWGCWTTVFPSLGHNCCQPVSLLTVKGKQRHGYWRKGGQREGGVRPHSCTMTHGGKEQNEMVEEWGRNRRRQGGGPEPSEQQAQQLQCRQVIWSCSKKSENKGLCVNYFIYQRARDKVNGKLLHFCVTGVFWATRGSSFEQNVNFYGVGKQRLVCIILQSLSNIISLLESCFWLPSFGPASPKRGLQFWCRVVVSELNNKRKLTMELCEVKLMVLCRSIAMWDPYRISSTCLLLHIHYNHFSRQTHYFKYLYYSLCFLSWSPSHCLLILPFQ